RYSGTGTSAEVASMGSRPAMICVASAASSTVRPNTPTWSSDDANATSPNRLTRPYVGFTPTIPQNAAGCRTDPPVSDPSAIGTTPAATAAADPPDEPPGTRVQSTGFNVGPNALCSVDDPIANSSMFVLQAMTAPAARSRVTTVASYGLTYPSRMREPQDVGIRNVAMLSLIATGTPCNGPESTEGRASRSSARMALSPDARSKFALAPLMRRRPRA